jgi:heme ABC exporter ATP-binding subunit CcmA
MTTLLDARQLTKFYGLRPILRGVSLTVQSGECLAVLGANGSGKTTLLRMLATLSAPNSGALTIDGVDAIKQPERARAHIGVVSHQSLVYPDLSAFENLRFHAELHGLSDATRRVEDALRRVNLWARAHDPARTFSRGMIQRLTIARATLHDPALLLLDEPFTGLDQPSAATLSGLLREAAGAGRGVIMTTHEFGRGLDGVTRAVVIHGGMISGELRESITTDAVSRWLAEVTA